MLSHQDLDERFANYFFFIILKVFQYWDFHFKPEHY